MDRPSHPRRAPARWAAEVPHEVERADGTTLTLFGHHEVRAVTKSDARALVKAELEIGRKGRLPVGARVRRVREVARP